MLPFRLLAAVIAQHGAHVAGTHPVVPGFFTPDGKEVDGVGQAHIENIFFRIEHVGDSTAGGVVEDIEVPIQKRGVNGSGGQQPLFGSIALGDVDGLGRGSALGQRRHAQSTVQLSATVEQNGPVFCGHVDFPGGVVQLGDFEIVPVVGRRHSGEAQQDHQDCHHGQSLHQREAVVSLFFHMFGHGHTSMHYA